MLRAVIDPGVLVAALLSSKGAPAQLLLSWQAGKFALVVSPQLIDELKRVLARPKFRRYVSQEDADSYVELLRSTGSMADDAPRGERYTADPGDDYLVGLARASRADALVSGDPHLLELEEAQPPVLSPRSFFERLLATSD